MVEKYLRRVTFSGRLLQQNAEQSPSSNWEWAKIVAYLIIDFVLVFGITVSLFLLFQGKGISPHISDFPCSDKEIRKPFKENTVGLKHLLFVSLGSPLLFIFVNEALIFYNAEGKNKIQKFATTTSVTYLKYVLVYAGCTFAMEFLKCYFGRLRPHFVAVCQPDWSLMNCDVEGTVIAGIDTICQNPNKRRIRTARTSFPSGHTAAAVHAFLFIAVYLIRTTQTTGLRHLRIFRNISLPIFFTWTILTAISRVTDYWHHPTDVLGGTILAVSFIIPSYYNSWKTRSLVYSARGIEPKSKEE